MRKKSSACLGSLALVLPTKDAANIAEILSKNIIDKKNSKELLYYTVALNAVVKNVGQKLGSVVSIIVAFILQDITERKEVEPDDYHFQNELIDYYLSIVDNLIKKCPNDINPHLDGILSLIHDLIKYDPNIVDDEMMDIEESRAILISYYH